MFDQSEVQMGQEMDGDNVGPVNDDRESMLRHRQLSSLKTPDSNSPLRRPNEVCACTLLGVPIQGCQAKVIRSLSVLQRELKIKTRDGTIYFQRIRGI